MKAAGVSSSLRWFYFEEECCWVSRESVAKHVLTATCFYKGVLTAFHVLWRKSMLVQYHSDSLEQFLSRLPVWIIKGYYIEVLFTLSSHRRCACYSGTWPSRMFVYHLPGLCTQKDFASTYLGSWCLSEITLIHRLTQHFFSPPAKFKEKSPHSVCNSIYIILRSLCISLPLSQLS